MMPNLVLFSVLTSVCSSGTKHPLAVSSRFFRLISGLAMLITFCPAQAIVIRHDVASSEYEHLGAQFHSVATFWAHYQGKPSVAGTGTLIAKSWILTAAHVANVLKPGAKVQIGTDFYQVKRAVLHPEWRDQHFGNDIALVELSEPTSLSDWPELYTQSDEQGMVLVFVGRGDTGNGLKGVTIADTKLRAATNQVIQAQEQWLRFRFDQAALALPLEGISGPGDSGGPALLRKDDRWYLVGVSAWQNAEPTQWQEGRYGVIENYSRVSHHLQWIRQSMNSATAPERTSANNGRITDTHQYTNTHQSTNNGHPSIHKRK